ncbi:hypothetical protein BC829DRAFT_397714 [Chytridium lagenaria]|nr:hypothetical protein BC829DRAFT_397714 [Chytridium lagenaria]
MNGIVGIVDDTGMGGKRPARRKTVKESSGSVLLCYDKVSTHTIVQGLDDDDMAVKRDFLIKLSRTLQCMERLRIVWSIIFPCVQDVRGKADYIVFPVLGMIMISFGGESSHSNTHIVKTAQGFNMGKLAQAVKADNDYPWYIILATHLLTLCILGFGGNWVDAMIAAVLGLFVGILSLLSERYSSVTYLLEFFARYLCTAFIARSLHSIAILLPGLSLTISIIELSTRNMVSGTVRLFGALFTAMLLGFGMTIGGALVFWNSYPSSGTTSSACGAPQNPLWALLLFWPMSFAVNIFFQANMHQWPIMTASAALGWITSLLLNMAPHFQTNASAVTAISSLVIGLVSNLHSRLTHDVAVAPVLSGILLQVPGSLGVRSSLSFFVSTSQSNQSIVDGVQFTFQMLTIGMSLALGLFVATFLVWPLRGPKYKYLTI